MTNDLNEYAVSFRTFEFYENRSPNQLRIVSM